MARGRIACYDSDFRSLSQSCVKLVFNMVCPSITAIESFLPKEGVEGVSHALFIEELYLFFRFV